MAATPSPTDQVVRALDPELTQPEQIMADALADSLTQMMLIGAYALGIAVAVYVLVALWRIARAYF